MAQPTLFLLLLNVGLFSFPQPVCSWHGASPLSWVKPRLWGLRQQARAERSSSIAVRSNEWSSHAKYSRCWVASASEGAKPLKYSSEACTKGSLLRSARPRRGASELRAKTQPNSAADGLKDVSGDADGASKDTLERRRRDVVTVSPEFTALCQAQFEVLASVLGASRCDLYFRREDPRTGHLEFVPAAVYPEKQRVWVVGEGPTGRPATGAIELAGFIPATSLLPEYPFVKTNREGGPSNVVEIEGGGLSVPIEYGSVVLGMLAVWREGSKEWTEAERAQVQAIATSLALAVVLDQKHQWQEAVQAESLRKMLSETLHQVKNSLSAVRMFGKLLLRRLPGNDKMNRELAKDILIQSDRLVDLLLPIDSMTRQPSLGPGTGASRPPPFLLQGSGDAQESRRALVGAQIEGSVGLLDVERASADTDEAGDMDFQVPGIDEDETLQQAVKALRLAKVDGAIGGVGTGAGMRGGLVKCRMEEALEPIISAGQAIAEFDGVHFECSVSPQLPAVQADTRVLQEAVSNVLDNALKYVLVRGDDPARPTVSFTIQPCQTPLQGVEVVILDNGAGVMKKELKKLCDEGFRGKRSAHVPGTGLGLHIADQLVELLNGELLLERVSEGSGLRVRIQMREIV